MTTPEDNTETIPAEAEESVYYDALLDLVSNAAKEPLSIEAATEILERYGLEGLATLVSENAPAIPNETAAIENLFEDFIDTDALGRELSS